MKLLGSILLWVAAIGLTLLVIRRLRRGERVLLRGNVSPRLIRMVAILVVAFGWRPSEADAAPPPPKICGAGPDGRIDPKLLPKPVIDPSRPTLPDTVPSTYAELSELGYERGAANIFQRMRETAERIELDDAELEGLVVMFAQGDRIARRYEAYMLAQAELGPRHFRPWMSKAAPPRERPPLSEVEGKVLATAMSRATAGPWEQEATIDLDVVAGIADAKLMRHGPTALREHATIRLRRFDIVRAGPEPLVLSHTTLGTITIPARGVLTAWNLPRHLDATATRKIEALVRRAATCDAAAMSALTRMLPAAHAALRAANKPELQLLLALFDE